MDLNYLYTSRIHEEAPGVWTFLLLFDNLSTKTKNRHKVIRKYECSVFEPNFESYQRTERKNGHILPTGQWYAPSAVINVAKM